MTASSVSYQQEPPDGWDEYVTSHPQGSVYHASRWGALIQNSFNHKTFFLTVMTQKGFSGVLPLVFMKSKMFGKNLVSMPYFNYGGLLADENSAAEQLIAAALILKKELRADYIELRQTSLVPGGWPTKSHKVIMLLPLPPDPDTLWQSFKTKHAILDKFPENSHIVVVRNGNQSIAAGFLISHRNKMEVPWASSLRRFNHLSPNMLLYWNMLKYSITQGFQTFDFGRSTRDSGTFSFKEQWGAIPHETFWVYPGKDASQLPDHSPQNPRYKWATRVWTRLPLFVANRCGPWIVGNIP